MRTTEASIVYPVRRPKVLGSEALGDVLRSVHARRLIGVVFLYALLAILVVINDGPLVWMALTSVKPESEILSYPPTGIPSAPTFANYQGLFTESPFGTYLSNSGFIAICTTAIVVTFGTIGAYALVRFKFGFVRWVGEASLVAYMVPSILLLVPLVRLMYVLQLDDNPLALIIIYSTLLLPFGLWTLRSYFRGLSIELEQAAMVDGCTRFGAFWRVVLPQAVPGMIAASIFTFNASWSEFMFAQTLMTTPDRFTLSPGLVFLTPTNGLPQWGVLMAGAVTMTIPLVILFALFQRYLVDAWGGAGAVKG